MIKFFWQEDCPKCADAKLAIGKLEAEGVKVERYNTSSPGGLAEATLHDVLATPAIIIIEDGIEKKSWRGEVPSLEAIKKEL